MRARRRIRRTTPCRASRSTGVPVLAGNTVTLHDRDAVRADLCGPRLGRDARERCRGADDLQRQLRRPAAVRRRERGVDEQPDDHRDVRRTTGPDRGDECRELLGRQRAADLWPAGALGQHRDASRPSSRSRRPTR